MDPLRIGIAGLGTVAQGLLETLQANSSEIARRAGRSLSVVRVASRSPKPEVDLGKADFSTDLSTLHDADIDVVVELIGGEDPALQLVRDAMAHRQSVVTANKAIIARHGNELVADARREGVMLGFEAAVAGGVPIVNALTRGMVGNRVQWIAGIINGTCNYILTAMADRGSTFAAALEEAQGLGYAEADPAFDVEGVDAAHKLTILAALAFDTDFRFDAVYTEGITRITTEDIEYARELGYAIKHLGITRSSQDGIEARVHPCLIPQNNMLANVNDVMNAVLVYADAAGPTLYYGAGAGARPTASAVIADLVAIARGDAVDFKVGSADRGVLNMEQVETAYYLRIPSLDEPGVFARVATILSEHAISIEGAIQRERAVHFDTSASWVPIIILTQRVRERVMTAALGAVQTLPEIVGEIMRIRVEQLK